MTRLQVLAALAAAAAVALFAGGLPQALASIDRIQVRITDPTRVKSVAVRLCSGDYPLHQWGGTFSAFVHVACEEAGEIVVQHKDGEQTICPVGDLTPNLGMTHKVWINGSDCLPDRR